VKRKRGTCDSLDNGSRTPELVRATAVLNIEGTLLRPESTRSGTEIIPSGAEITLITARTQLKLPATEPELA
jgi:hypothetical protein